jgi:hypothetical protein
MRSVSLNEISLVFEEDVAADEDAKLVTGEIVAANGAAVRDVEELIWRALRTRRCWWLTWRSMEMVKHCRLVKRVERAAGCRVRVAPPMRK